MAHKKKKKGKKRYAIALILPALLIAGCSLIPDEWEPANVAEVQAVEARLDTVEKSIDGAAGSAALLPPPWDLIALIGLGGAGAYVEAQRRKLRLKLQKKEGAE